MAGQVNVQRAERQQGRRKIFLHFILLFATVLDSRDQRATIGKRYIKCFHATTKVQKLNVRDDVNISP